MKKFYWTSHVQILAGLFIVGLVFVSGATSAQAATLQELQATVASILEQVNLLPSTTIPELQVKVGLLQSALQLQIQINDMINAQNNPPPPVPPVLRSGAILNSPIVTNGEQVALTWSPAIGSSNPSYTLYRRAGSADFDYYDLPPVSGTIAPISQACALNQQSMCYIFSGGSGLAAGDNQAKTTGVYTYAVVARWTDGSGVISNRVQTNVIGTATSPNAQVIAPNGGETLFIGSNYTVSSYTANQDVGYKLLSDQAVSSSNPLGVLGFLYQMANASSFSWQVGKYVDTNGAVQTAPAGAGYHIGLVISGQGQSSFTDVSDGAFTIIDAQPTPPPSFSSFSMSASSFSSSVRPGDTLTIKWQTANAPANSAVRINLEVGAGLIAYHLPTSGAYIWRVPSLTEFCPTDIPNVCGRDLHVGQRYRVSATLYTPANACFGFCAPDNFTISTKAVSGSIPLTILDSVQADSVTIDNLVNRSWDAGDSKVVRWSLSLPAGTPVSASRSVILQLTRTSDDGSSSEMIKQFPTLNGLSEFDQTTLRLPTPGPFDGVSYRPGVYRIAVTVIPSSSQTGGVAAYSPAFTINTINPPTNVASTAPVLTVGQEEKGNPTEWTPQFNWSFIPPSGKTVQYYQLIKRKNNTANITGTGPTPYSFQNCAGNEFDNTFPRNWGENCTDMTRSTSVSAPGSIFANGPWYVWVRAVMNDGTSNNCNNTTCVNSDWSNVVSVSGTASQPTFTLRLDPSTQPQTISAGGVSANLATFVAESSQNDATTIRSLSMNLSGTLTPTQLTNCTISNNSGLTLNTGSNVVNPSSTNPIIFTFDLPMTVVRTPNGGLFLRCNVAAGANGTLAWTLSGVTSAGPSQAAGTLPLTAPTVTVVSGGRFGVSLDSSAPSYTIVGSSAASPATGIFANALRIRAFTENVSLTKLGLKLTSGSANDLVKVTVWDGAAKIGEATFGSSLTAIATLTVPGNNALGILLTQDQDRLLTIKADFTAVGLGQLGTAGDLVKIDFNNAEGIGTNSGTIITGTGSTAVEGLRLSDLQTNTTSVTFLGQFAPNALNSTLQRGTPVVLRFSRPVSLSDRYLYIKLLNSQGSENTVCNLASELAQNFCTWTPSPVSTGNRLTIYDDSTKVGTSGYFSITEADRPTTLPRIISPNGGEALILHSNANIQFDLPSSVWTYTLILVSADNQSTQYPLFQVSSVNSTSWSAGSYGAFRDQYVPSGRYYMRICESSTVNGGTATDRCDISDSPFTLTDVPARLTPTAVTASRSAAGFPASNATDNDPASMWVTSLSTDVGVNNNDFIALDFGVTKHITKLKWKASVWEAPYPSNGPSLYRVQRSDNGLDWIDVGSVVDLGTQAKDPRQFTGNESFDVITRYIRLKVERVNDGATGWSLGLKDFWAEGTADTSVSRLSPAQQQLANLLTVLESLRAMVR